MDFGSLLNAAQKNEQMPKKEIRYYSTKFEPPKKEGRSKQLSENIKKFLARKEAEEKQKALEAKLKKEELLALRSQDKKASRRVAVMLKRTKSANKSVIQDAVDNENTAVTLAGPSQPDEDDYGYVSQEASAFYNKMMAKYNNMPEEDKFPKSKRNVNTNLKEIKDRVQAAIQREHEEALLPHKRKRKPKESEQEEPEYSKQENEERPKPKPKPAPPPINFNDLLKIAEKKQFEPIKIEPKVEPKDDERPMTKKQKREFEKEKAWRERKEKGNTTPPSPPKIPKLNQPTNGKIPKIMKKPEDRKVEDKRKIDDRIPKKVEVFKRPDVKPNAVQPNERNKINKPRPELEKSRVLNKLPSSKISNSNYDNRSQTTKPPSIDKNKSLIRKDVSKDVKLKNLPPSSKPKQFPPADVRPKQFPPADVRPKQFPPADVRPKQFPPADLRSKQFPPTDLRPKQLPPTDVQRRLNNSKGKPPIGHKRRILDDDSEYDSEMDDFIDDGPENGEDYSKYISEIFGYDKSRYRSEDHDDANMESSFSQMMKEEFISGKIGLMEDLEDMKLEAEEKRKKAMMKKMRK